MNSTKFNYDHKRQRIGNLVTGILNHFGESSAENLTQCIKNRSNEKMENIYSTVRRSLRCGLRHGFLVKTDSNKYSLSCRYYQTDSERGKKNQRQNANQQNKNANAGKKTATGSPCKAAPTSPTTSRNLKTTAPVSNKEETKIKRKTSAPGSLSTSLATATSTSAATRSRSNSRSGDEDKWTFVKSPNSRRGEKAKKESDTIYKECEKYIENQCLAREGGNRCEALNLITHETCGRIISFKNSCQFHIDAHWLLLFRQSIVTDFMTIINVNKEKGMDQINILEDNDMSNMFSEIKNKSNITPEEKLTFIDEIRIEYLEFLRKYDSFIYNKNNSTANQELMKTLFGTPPQRPEVYLDNEKCFGLSLKTGLRCENKPEKDTSNQTLATLCVQHQCLHFIMKGFTREYGTNFSYFNENFTKKFWPQKPGKKQEKRTSYCVDQYMALIWRYELMRICGVFLLFFSFFH